MNRKRWYTEGKTFSNIGESGERNMKTTVEGEGGMKRIMMKWMKFGERKQQREKKREPIKERTMTNHEEKREKQKRIRKWHERDEQ